VHLPWVVLFFVFHGCLLVLFQGSFEGLLYTIVSCFLPVALRVSSGSGVSGLDGAFCFGQGGLLLFSTGDDATVCIASTPVCELLLSVVNEVGGCFGGCVFHCVLLLPLFLLPFYHTNRQFVKLGRFFCGGSVSSWSIRDDDFYCFAWVGCLVGFVVHGFEAVCAVPVVEDLLWGVEFHDFVDGLVQDSVSLLVFVVWPYWQVFASEFFYCPVELAFCFLEGFGLVSALGSEAYESD